MGLCQFETETEDELGLLFKSGEAHQVKAGLGLELASLRHVIVIIGVDKVENVFFFFGGEDVALLIYPVVQIRAGWAEARPFIGVVVKAEAQDRVVELQQSLLN